MNSFRLFNLHICIFERQARRSFFISHCIALFRLLTELYSLPFSSELFRVFSFLLPPSVYVHFVWILPIHLVMPRRLCAVCVSDAPSQRQTIPVSIVLTARSRKGRRAFSNRINIHSHLDVFHFVRSHTFSKMEIGRCTARHGLNGDSGTHGKVF